MYCPLGCSGPIRYNCHLSSQQTLYGISSELTDLNHEKSSTSSTSVTSCLKNSFVAPTQGIRSVFERVRDTAHSNIRFLHFRGSSREHEKNIRNSQRVVEPQIVTMDTDINNRDDDKKTYHKQLHHSTGTNNNNDNDNQAVGSELRDIVRSEMRKIVQVSSIKWSLNGVLFPNMIEYHLISQRTF